jgi:type VI protein secretion system component VasK
MAEESVQALMQGFDGTNHVEQFYGPWALFQLISQGDVRGSNKPNQYIFDVNLGGFESSFMILTTSDLSVFQLNTLKGYALPDKL